MLQSQFFGVKGKLSADTYVLLILAMNEVYLYAFYGTLLPGGVWKN
jgi:hypothetical protein